MATPVQRPSVFGFGAALLDQALFAEHHDGEGWREATLQARAAGDLPMASGAVQYGFSCFEGMKAFRGPDGSVHLFRIDAHAARLRASCERLCLPVLPEANFIEHAARYVDASRDMVPEHGKGSIYLRPTLAACEEFLGMRTARAHRFAILGTPVPAPAGKPLKLWVEREFVRAAPGGMGSAKTGGNYAAGMLGAERAKARGFDQVIWLDAPERRFLAEAGVMNVFVVIGEEVLTPPLDGTILAGITRSSCMALLQGWGKRVTERPIALAELTAAHASGALGEVFGTGTAACVAPIIRIGGEHEDLELQSGPIATRLRTELGRIQDGSGADPHGWRRVVVAS